MRNSITFIHSLNNYTGSPNVLATIIREFYEKGYEVDLITSKSDGFLSNIKSVKYSYTWYVWTEIKILTSLLLFLSQLQVFFRVLLKSRRNSVFYINTIIPFGAALACYLSGKKFVFHVHENMQSDKTLYRFLRWVYSRCNLKSIFVSQYLQTTAVGCRNGKVVYNVLDMTFVEKAKKNRIGKNKHPFTVLMVASLRKFKGLDEFVSLAHRMPNQSFELVLSANKVELDYFFKDYYIPVNLKIFPEQKDLHPFYTRAKVVTQLSHPESWIETFGMTILEAMIYGVPTIVPNIGGPLELVDDGVNGFLVNPHDVETIKDKIQFLFENKDEYEKMSEAALKKAEKFTDSQQMFREIESYIFQ